MRKAAFSGLLLLLLGSVPYAQWPGEETGRFLRYEIAVEYAVKGRLVLTVVRDDGTGEEVREDFGLYRAESFLPLDLPETDWMVFRGQKPPFVKEGYEIRSDPWIIWPRKGLWRVASIPRRVETRKGGFVLQNVRPDEKGVPKLYYIHEVSGKTLVRKVKDLEYVRIVKFLPPVRE